MKSKKVLNTVISIILWIVILLAAIFAFTTLATRDVNKVSSFLGFTPLTVQSDSMVPVFKSGDLIIIKKCDAKTLAEGDIITFHTIIENQYTLNTHRIDSIKEYENGIREYSTKGDNNAVTDKYLISSGDIVGKYVGKVQGFGNVIDFLSGSVGFFVVIVLPMLIFFIYQVYNLVMVSIKLKKAVALEEAQSEGSKLSEAEAALEEAKRKQAELEAKLAEMEKKNENSK